MIQFLVKRDRCLVSQEPDWFEPNAARGNDGDRCAEQETYLHIFLCSRQFTWLRHDEGVAGPVRIRPRAKEPFVAGWSDARKTPPAEIAELIELMDEHSLAADALLKIPKLSNANYQAYQARRKELLGKLSSTVEITEGRSVRIGDIMAAEAYRRLKQ